MTSAAPSRDTPMPHAHRWALFGAVVVLRGLWAGSFGPSDGELLAWASLDFAAPLPAPFGIVALIAPGVSLLGDSPIGLRGLFALVSALPVLLVGRHPAAVWLAATLPILTVPGSLATGAAPLAALWLGTLRLAHRRPGWAGLLAGVGTAVHPVGGLIALPVVLSTPRRAVFAGAALVGAAPFLPGSVWCTTLPTTGELSPAGLAVAALGLGGPLLLPGVLPRLRASGRARTAAWTSVLGVAAIVAWSAPAPLLAAPLAVGILAVAPTPGEIDDATPLPAPHRVAWPSVGLGAMASLALALLLRFPIAPLPADPRARFVDAGTLAQTIEAWDIPTVYALRPVDIARLRWHGVRATTPPPVHPLDLPDAILLVAPQSADPDLPYHMGWDHERDGPHTVVAHISADTPTGSRPVAAWSVSAWIRAPERTPPP